ncbi:hypothetical protein PMAYCL1PPCAC_28950 [Pristionchus mayeri]|uniref:Globin domain-containing protein n=1 Tax=Pristionchus mayeri TaxID=1317129 RepID=A0AAN5IC67_9BILA|nr:hypothetical protein PMAYCL1PPCAC_28950 [Pristionchus mayeri]
MGSSQSSSGVDETTNEKVERLFRLNKRNGRSRSLDTRQESSQSTKSPRPVGGSQSAKFPKNASNRYATTRIRQPPEGPHVKKASCQSGLTQEQKRILETCWVKASPKQIRKSTEDIFASILNHDRSLAVMFRLDDVPINRIRENQAFKKHAANFALVLDLVIKNIPDNVDSCCQALQALGGQHVSLRDRGFDGMYWDVFTDYFEHNPPATFKNEQDRDAWSAMILFILAQMKLGFRQVDRKPDRLSVTALYQ